MENYETNELNGENVEYCASTPATSEGYSLLDAFMKSGNDFNDFRNLIDEITEITKEHTIKIDDMVLASFAGITSKDNGTVVYCYRKLEREPLENFEKTGSLYNGKSTFALFAARGDNLLLLEDEQNNTHLHVVVRGIHPDLPGHMYIAPGAMSQLLALAGMAAGNNSDEFTLARDVALASKLLRKGESYKLITREVRSEGCMLTKVFGIVTPNYTKIELSILYRAVDLLVKSAELGKTEVSYWRVDQDYAEIRVEFPDAADGYTAAYGLPNRIVPGLRLSAGDTGHASVQVEPTYRVDSSLAIGDESVRKVHRGEITEESILEDIDTKVLTRLKSFPEALIDRLGVSIGTFDLTNDAGRRENRKLILKCIKEGMKMLGINKVLGTKRKKVVIEKLKREIDPALHYTEYDIALILMGLAERVHLESREVAIRLAKACGKAASVPYYELALASKDEDDEIFIDEI